MEIESEAETQITMIKAKEGDTNIIRWAENIITTITLGRTRGVTECVQNIVVEALRIKVIEGNTAEDMFSYIPTEEMLIAALIDIGIGNRVQDAYNIRQR